MQRRASLRNLSCVSIPTARLPVMDRANRNVWATEIVAGMAHLGLRRFLQAGVAHICEDTHDGPPALQLGMAGDATSDGIAIGEIDFGELLADDDWTVVGQGGTYARGGFSSDSPRQTLRTPWQHGIPPNTIHGILEVELQERSNRGAHRRGDCRRPERCRVIAWLELLPRRDQGADGDESHGCQCEAGEEGVCGIAVPEQGVAVDDIAQPGAHEVRDMH